MLRSISSARRAVTSRTGRKLHQFLNLIAAAACIFPLSQAASAQSSDELAAGFANPPAAARPRVWWHWMDGNVSAAGIRQDLDWLHSVGIGGVHNFDANLSGGGAQDVSLVGQRVAYLTPQWREMFRLAVTQAQQNGMEFTIAASPGWSESGGPWVKPAQGMKKLVWSETTLSGGTRFNARLLVPPRVTGPFQNVPFSSVPFADDEKPPEYYADVAVVAFRTPASEVATSAIRPVVTSSAGPLDAARLFDGDVAQAVLLPYGQGNTAWVEYAYAKPTRIQSLTVSVARPAGGAPSDFATGAQIWLEASDGSAFRPVVEIPRDGAPQQTLNFAPVTAREFRLVLARPQATVNPLEQLFGPQGPPPTAHSIYEFTLHGGARVNRFEDKAAFTNRSPQPEEDTSAVEASDALTSASVIDLTGKMAADGTLDWTPPRGEWTVLRFGYSLTGRTNHPASREGTGLEVDKLNKRHVTQYFNDYLAEYTKTLGPELIGKKGLQFMLTDSYEAGIANWTDDVLDQFNKRRGYDPHRFLPVFAGRIVDSSKASDRFLWDFRQTLSDLIADAHYGQLSALLHEHGMGRYGESHEGGRAFVGDGMQVKKSADVPMGALWSSTLGQPRETFDADIRESASVAHLYGQNLVAAESLTAFGNTFAFTPETLKPYADRELAMGLNRFVLHTSVHQPDDRLGPGATLGPFGQWFTRHETWAAQAQPWVAYLTRSAYLLQQGKFVADVAYLYGEDNNITNLFGLGGPPVPLGYNFDYINADALINLLTVRNGKLVTASGMQYRVLALDPSTRRMSLPLLRKIRDLVAQGGTVVGERPSGTPSLADSETEFTAIAEALWGPAKPQAGGGRVLANQTLAQALQMLAIDADCQFIGAKVGPELRFVHRRLDQGDLYFVSNGSSDAHNVEASFRVSGKAPEIWRADTGKMEPASFRIEGGRTIVALKLEASDAVFVVFRQTTSEVRRTIPERAAQVVASLEGPWDVSFPPNHGAPPSARFATLSSWTTNADPGIRYFSGTSTYATTVTVEANWLGKDSRIQLNLGDVKNIAEVLLNGRAVGIAWKTPFVLDITDELKTGKNQLEVRVTNVWPNRMIGDKQPGAQRIAFATFDPFKADSPLLPSGLLGPVRIVQLRTH